MCYAQEFKEVNKMQAINTNVCQDKRMNGKLIGQTPKRKLLEVE